MVYSLDIEGKSEEDQKKTGLRGILVKW